MDTAFWTQLGVTLVIGGIAIYYEREQVLLIRRSMSPASTEQFRPNWVRRTWPLFVIAVLALSSWIPYFIRPDDLPPFPDPHSYVARYSQSIEAQWCRVLINGDRFLKFAGHYRVAGACYAYDGVGDVLDVPKLQVGKTHDIINGQIEMVTRFGPGFMEYLQENGAIGLSHVVLLIPNGVDPGDFSTLRQAKAMGVKIVNGGTSTTQNFPMK